MKSERNEDGRAGVVLDFLEIYMADLALGRVKALDSYLARFPGHEPIVRGEFARQEALREGREHEPDSARGARVPVTSDSELLRHLELKLAGPDRYVRGAEIGRGAMSRVYSARDVELGREVAMKVHDRKRTGVLGRFVREARVIGRLDHPGIVPVHDIAVDRDGQLFFTMRLIRGRSLKELLLEPERRTDPRIRRSILEAIVRVCDTLAFAHAAGVVHRDVKPSNVMVGDFGETYLVDWGLAQLDGERGDARSPDVEGPPLETLAGQVLGTPAYMSPEQAAGKSAAVGKHSDIYAVGALLYHHLVGHAPFCEGDSTPSTAELLERVLTGPPPRIHATAREREPELASIAERAMARQPSERYADCRAMGADLRAHLDGHAVHAYSRGLAYRAIKWVRRNRLVSAGVALTLVLGSVAALSFRTAHARESDLRLLADLRGPLELLDEFDALWPAAPERADAVASWIERAEALRQRSAGYEEMLVELRGTRERLAIPEHVQEAYDRRRRQQLDTARIALHLTNGMLEATERGEMEEDTPIGKLRSNMASLERWMRALEARPLAPESRYFADSATQLLFDRLEQFLAELDSVVGIEEPRDRLLLARAARDLARLADAPEGPVDWAIASEAVRASPAYRGLELAPQRGLVPLGPDPVSGLWEFAHAQSGSIPERDGAGRLVLDAESAIVLVLLPGGEFVGGAQTSDPDGALYDPRADRHESPTLDCDLAPFFIAKHELSLAQWCRISGLPADRYYQELGDDPARYLLPAYGATGESAKAVLRAYGLELPTSLGWEYAARAGTTTIWWSGNERSSLEGCGNVQDKTRQRAANEDDVDVAGPVAFEDGYAGQSPVGAFRPNPFGLHDTIGNVAEWCRDVTWPYMNAFLPLTGELAKKASCLQILRGGNCVEGAFSARSGAREYVLPDFTSDVIGIRASRRLDDREL